MSKTPFADRVYAACKRIPKGKVSTYGEIARHLHNSPRAVGQALRKNPYAPTVPCHRVVAADGTIGGFQGRTQGRSITKKIHLLTEEGVQIQNNTIDLDKYGFTFT